MTWALLGLSAGALAAAGTAVVLALRVSGLKGEVAKVRIRAAALNEARKRLEGQLESASREAEKSRGAHRRQLDVLRVELTELEEDLAECNTPAMIRERLTRLIERAAGIEGRSES